MIRSGKEWYVKKESNNSAKKRKEKESNKNMILNMIWQIRIYRLTVISWWGSIEAAPIYLWLKLRKKKIYIYIYIYIYI